MPIYEFQCQKCGTRFEKLCGFDPGDVHCPDCGDSGVKRLVSAFYSVRRGAPESSMSGSSACNGCRKTSCAGCR